MENKEIKLNLKLNELYAIARCIEKTLGRKLFSTLKDDTNLVVNGKSAYTKIDNAILEALNKEGE